MKITVTQEDIDNATVGAINCPIARAVKRQTGHPFRVTASSFAIYLHTEDHLDLVKMYRPGPDACEFMANFDKGEPVEPAEFEVSELLI